MTNTVVDKRWFSSPPLRVSLSVAFYGKEGKSVRVCLGTLWAEMFINVRVRVSVWG